MNNIPKLRFPEFTDAWEKCKLGEVGKTYTGLSGKTKEDFGHGQAKFITYMNVFGNPIASSSGVDRIEIDSRQNEVKFGDVFFTTSSETPEEVGMSSIWLENTENVYLNSFCFGYRPIKIFDPYFFAFYLRSPSIRAKIILLAQGISRYNISKTKMMEQEISIPTLPEQQKIGNLFKQLDRLITLHKRKWDDVILLKKALLQKMFPKNGSDFPEIRFPEFTDAWEKCKLGEVARFSKGSGYSKNDLVEHGKPIILYGRLYTNYQTIIDEIDTFTVEKNKSVISEGNEVLIPASGESAEEIARASAIEKSGIILGGDLNIIKILTKLSPHFLAITLSNGNQKLELSKKAQGKSVVHLRNSDLETVVLLHPTLPEQQKIGNLFKQLNRLITLHK